MQGEQSQGGSVEQGSVVAAPEASGVAGGEGGGGAEAVSEPRREDNRHYRRQRHRDCYCRGRNKNCPKCGGTGQLLPNWRENLQAARLALRPATPVPAGAGSPNAAPTPVREPQPAGGYDRAGVQERDRGYDRGGYDRNGQDRNGQDRGGQDRGGQDRSARRDRWQNRNQNRGGGFQGNRPAQKSALKMCPMCGEYVSNLRAHVLARHDD